MAFDNAEMKTILNDLNASMDTNTAALRIVHCHEIKNAARRLKPHKKDGDLMFLV